MSVFKAITASKKRQKINLKKLNATSIH